MQVYLYERVYVFVSGEKETKKWGDKREEKRCSHFYDQMQKIRQKKVSVLMFCDQRYAIARGEKKKAF